MWKSSVTIIPSNVNGDIFCPFFLQQQQQQIWIEEKAKPKICIYLLILGYLLLTMDQNKNLKNPSRGRPGRPGRQTVDWLTFCHIWLPNILFISKYKFYLKSIKKNQIFHVRLLVGRLVVRFLMGFLIVGQSVGCVFGYRLAVWLVCLSTCYNFLFRRSYRNTCQRYHCNWRKNIKVEQDTHANMIILQYLCILFSAVMSVSCKCSLSKWSAKPG